MATSSVLENETGTLPPASLPPGDPAQTHAGGGGAVDGATTVTTSSAGLLVEVEVLRRTVGRLGDELAGLRRAMASRAVIDQAKGAVRVVTGLSGDEAFALLATRSQHTNRRLADVAADVLAAVEAPDRTTGVRGVLHLPDQRPAATDGLDETGWRTRRRWDAETLAVTDIEQLRALTDLAECLAAAPDRAQVVDVLLQQGCEALGAFGANLSSLAGSGAAVAENEGLDLGDGPPTAVALDAVHPTSEVLATGRPLLLTRAELALRFPGHPRPPRLRGLVVLPVGPDSERGTAWSLYLDQAVPADRGTRAFFARAARLASSALGRAR